MIKNNDSITSKFRKKYKWLSSIYYIGNMILPLSEGKTILKQTTKSFKSTKEKLSIITEEVKKQSETSIHDSRSSWAFAVKESGRTIEELNYLFLKRKYIWLIFFYLCIALTCFSIWSLIFVTFEINRLFAVTTYICLTFFTLLKAIICEFRLWQLQEKKVSEKEKGTFKYFLKENNFLKKTLGF